MGFFTKKNFLYKLIICLCIVLSLINFVGTRKVYAGEDDTGIGGVLMKPVSNLLLGLSDAIMNILQNSIMGTDATINIDNKDGINWGAWILGILAVVLVVVLYIIPGTQGIAAAITATAIKAALAYLAVNIVTAGGVHATVTAVSAKVLGDIAVLPTYTIGAEEIFSGRILLFDANIFNPKEVYVEYNVMDLESETPTSTGNTATLEQWDNLKGDAQNQVTKYYYESDGVHDSNPDDDRITSVNNSAYELRNVIAKWYYIIRTIALIGSMLILLYIGIRIIITSIAEEKAKYKQMLVDWIVALCLIVLMHYIMIFAHNIVESITNLFNNAVTSGEDIAIFSEPGDKLTDAVTKLENQSGNQYIFEEDGLKTIRWPTNMMGRFRVAAQNRKGDEKYVGYALAYTALVLYTLIFSFTYIKRLIYLLFLTVIAPLVALTYPIDKIHDGKAQAFDMWLKEYIFNLLIQPFHLLLYTIFVTMALDLAGTNVIYSLVVLGFMIPAEKFLRTMFGFNKASTPGLLAGAAGAAITMSAISSLGKFASKGAHGGNASVGKNKEEEDKGKLRTADSDHSQESLFSSAAGDNDINVQDNNIREQNPERDNSGRNLFSEDDEDTNRNRNTSSNNNSNIHSRSTSSSNTNNKRDGKVKRFFRATGRSAGQAIKKRAISELKAAPGRALRLGANIASATTLGALGLASGIVSGDFNTAVRNTTLGATTGIAVSKGISNRVSNSIKENYDSTAKERWQKDYYGEEYSNKMRDKADKEFMKDKQIRQLYKQELGLKNKEEVKDAMKDAKKYREYGINDNNIIIKAMKLDNGNAQNRASSRRIAAAKLAENSKTEKELQTNMKRFSKAPGINNKQVENMEKLVRKINNM